MAAGGTAKWTETKNVPVAGGLFSTALGDTSALPQSLFSGQALWLGIKVGADLEATPRQAIVPVAYALSLVPGAAITGSLSSPALRVSNSSGPALVTSGATTLGGNVTINGSLSGGTHAHSGADITSGTVVDARLDAALARDAEVAASYYNKTEADARYVNTTGPDAIFANSTVAALAVNQSGTGMASYFTSTTTYGVKGETASTTSGQAGLLGTAGSASTLNRVAGVLGNSTNGFGVAGTSTNHYGVVGFSSNSIGVRGESSTGANPGVWGGSWGTGPGVYGLGVNGHGVQGAGDTGSGSYGGYFSGYGGVYGYSPSWVGVYGTSNGNWGVYGESPSGYGVMGHSDGGIGVYGTTYTTTTYAGYFLNSGAGGTERGGGVAGFAGSGGIGYTHPGGSYWRAGGEFSGANGLIAAAAENGGYGILALNSLNGPALAANKTGGSNNAVQVTNGGTGSAVSIQNNNSSSTDAVQVFNYGTGRGAYFYNSSASAGDAYSFYNYGSGDTLNVYGNGAGNALYAARSGGGNYAGYFFGNVYVNGTLSKAGGSFKIDHPLDPANQYLEHSFVESPDMLNIYNGNITTDANGDATVVLPAYFEALNRDFRYQLTVIGQFAQAIVQDEIQANHFTIKTDKPGVKVSWQVTGIRQDPWANANRIPVEEAKPLNEQGTYLYPQGYNQPASTGVDYARNLARQSGPVTPTTLLTQTGSIPLTSPIAATLPINVGGTTLPIGPAQPSSATGQ